MTDSISPLGYHFLSTRITTHPVHAIWSETIASQQRPLARSVPLLDARRDLRRDLPSFRHFFVPSTKVLNNWKASWNTQRSATQVSWFRDSALEP